MVNIKFYIPRDATEYKCGYEEWSKEAKAICLCGNPAVVLTKNGVAFVGLCREHAAFFLNERSECYKDARKPSSKKPDFKPCSYRAVADLLK